MTYDRYVYPGTNVLKNKFGIMDAQKLSDVERGLSSIELFDIREEGIIGRFDAAHIKTIHARLFGDVYDWAGQYRDIQIYKGGTEFVQPDEISNRMDGLCDQIKTARYFIGRDASSLSDGLANTMAELNLIHPFREGNGRTQRLFIEQLALNVGYDLDFSKVSENDMCDASRTANRGDCRLMRYLISSNMQKLDGVTPVVSCDMKAKTSRRFLPMLWADRGSDKADEPEF